MIKLEYDPLAAGVRVSFIVRDGKISESLPNPSPLIELGRREGDTYIIPQTIESLDIVTHLLESAKRYEKE